MVAHRNAANITLEDGRDILKAFYYGRKVLRGEIPDWGTRWLHHQFHEGLKVQDIAHELGVPANTVSSWGSSTGFEPLSRLGR